MITESKSIGIFIDGGYFSKINEALSDQLSLNIKIKSLFDFIRAEIANRSGLEIANCYITESHYFRGRYRVNDANSKHLLFSERKFEDSLIENDVIFITNTYERYREMGILRLLKRG